MRPTDFCHSKDDVYPYLARSRLTPQLALRGRLAEFGLRVAGPGTSGASRHSGSLRRVHLCSFPRMFSSRASQQTEPLTLLSRTLVKTTRAFGERAAPRDRRDRRFPFAS